MTLFKCMRSVMKAPTKIVITGASSGIGEALAYCYAAPGTMLAITGRNEERLENVAAACRNRGAAVTAETVDVADRAAMARWIAQVDVEHPIDLVIANAGVDGSAYDGDERYYAIFEINLGGVLNTVLPAIALMQPRRRGQLAIVSSLAGFRGLPGAVAYSASKAGVRSLGEGLRGRLRADGIDVSVICPGFVTSRITASNTFPMPLLWPAPRAARYIRHGLARNKGRIAFPKILYALVWAMGLLPQPLLDALLARAPRKL